MVKHTIAVDWLQNNITAKFPSDFDCLTDINPKNSNFYFHRVRNGDEFYKHGFAVTYKDKPFAYIKTNSRNGKMTKENVFNMRIENNKFYELGWLDTTRQFFKENYFEHKSFTRLDIALDGGNYFEVMEREARGLLRMTGKAMITSRHTPSGKNNGYNIGMMKSKKSLAVYNKSKELNRSNKKYIFDYWKRCGLNTEKDVLRCELRLKNEESKKIVGIDFDKLDNFEHLASIMRTNLESSRNTSGKKSLGFFEFRIPDKNKNISRKESFCPIDWNSIGGSYLEKDSTRNSRAIFSAKLMMKKLYEIYLVTKNETYNAVCFDIAVNTDLLDYLQDKTPIWCEQFANKQGKNRNGLVSDDWTVSFKEVHGKGQTRMFKRDEVPIF